MFRRLPDLGGTPLRFTIDGRAATARDGDTVAAALLAEGVETCRTTPVSGAPRGPYCMTGVCFECLVTIDGVGNRQGCLVALADGMAVETQRGARSLDGSRPPHAGDLTAEINSTLRHAEERSKSASRSTHDRCASFETPAPASPDTRAPQDDGVGNVESDTRDEVGKPPS